MSKQPISTDRAPGALGPYSQAIDTGMFIFASGQLGLDPVSGELAEGVQEQARVALENVTAVLDAAGSSLDQVVKTTVFLQDMNDFAAMNEIYGQFFKEPYPARSAVQVARLPKDALVEIEVIALKK
ncbi:RidA family protein [Paenibacillus sp. PsM32]|uniref:RidA family protein n=1 Tax=Paenibacillus kyungheensis TaxID=1452732 RepID=A0AAX3M4F6_9BACL|nr:MULTISPECIES: RidA family protein [Paenibacillus]MDN4619447.1 RidA family protein [Paenibacillus sp. PsM32]MDQ1237012.1 2-iminobutanoate/2-iminopropanoate deaminase [Paenibacillus sp. SORGH_AS_0306]MDR6109372.1 2-iminobutanoate/2-iminopropanoate deaminase [Paenibacillus sp. SORGH_AS_0338]WCT56376.1 RidA family protein [Paenibacillus kyungheensis]WDF50506.1 RidA family protein [Paenibacillus sp. KACC 21273]